MLDKLKLNSLLKYSYSASGEKIEILFAILHVVLSKFLAQKLKLIKSTPQ